MKTISITVKVRVAVSETHHTPGCAQAIEAAVLEQVSEWAKRPDRMLLEPVQMSFVEEQP